MSCSPRSADFGTTYTKLILQPGFTTIINNFYVTPANKKKVGALPGCHRTRLVLLGHPGHRLGCHLSRALPTQFHLLPFH